MKKKTIYLLILAGVCILAAIILVQLSEKQEKNTDKTGTEEQFKDSGDSTKPFTERRQMVEANQTEHSAINGSEGRSLPSAPSAAKTDVNGAESFEELPDYLSDDSEKRVGKDTPDYNLTKNIFIAVVFISVLGLAGYFVLKKLSPNVKSGDGKTMGVSETLSLGTGKSLHILDVRGGHKFIIGVTSSSINLIADISGDDIGGQGYIDTAGANQ
jgi:hypothetical protein